MSADDRLSWRDAIRFWWHSAVAHRSHAQDIYYDHRTDAVTCGVCNQRWPR